MLENINIYFHNVGGLRTKVNTLQKNVSDNEYDVLILIETWLNSNFSDSQLDLFNYIIFRADRDSELVGKFRGGGVLIAIHKRIPCSKILAVSEIFDTLIVSLQVSKFESVIIGATYIPPGVDLEVYERYCSITKHALESCLDSLVIICGDYNLPNATWNNIDNTMVVDSNNDPKVLSITNCFSYLNMFQINYLPNSMNTFLDLVFSNEVNFTTKYANTPIVNESTR